MCRGKWSVRVALIMIVVALVAVVPMFAGSAVVGSVAGSMNATLGGQALLPNTTVFSGDSLQVKDGAAVVAVGQGSRLVFGRETVASFLREAGEVTVLLGQGNVSMYQAQPGVGLRVKVGTVSVVPAAGFKTLGEVAMVNGAVIVTAKEGKLRVEGNGPAVEVVKGKTITVDAKASARAPAPQGGAGAGVSTSTALQVGSIAAGGTSAVLSGVAISRAGDAKSAAAAADSTAASAVAAAHDAQAAAEAAGAAANSAGCLLNAEFPNSISPYVPPAGFSCT
ncbi:MAG: hypothetical protein LAO07_06150 [Acidobacteriia bacterium]|nr:hypothetical protein [Terriglobia bacterium]